MGSVSPSVNVEAETLLLSSAAAALARNRTIPQKQEQAQILLIEERTLHIQHTLSQCQAQMMMHVHCGEFHVRWRFDLRSHVC